MCPPNGVLFDNAGTPTEATDTSIADGADLAFGTDFATEGNIRLPKGIGEATLAWSIKKRNLADTHDLGLLSVYTSVETGEQFHIGCDPAGDLDATAFNGGTINTRLYLAALLTSAEVVIAGDYQGWSIQQLHPGHPDVAFTIAEHTNFAIAGARKYPQLADFGGGRAVFFWGQAKIRPEGSPTLGALAYCDPIDSNLYYRTPAGALHAMRAQPTQLLWGALELPATSGTFYLNPGGPAANATSTVVELRAAVAGRLSSLYVRQNIVGGADVRYTVLVDGLPTTIEATILNGEQDGEETGAFVDIAAGSRIAIEAEILSPGASPQAIVVTLGLSPVIPP